MLAGARQIAQFLNRRRRHEAQAHQPMGHQVGDPGCVVDIGLAPWQRAGATIDDERYLKSGSGHAFARRHLW
jgi:hypothetical protein